MKMVQRTLAVMLAAVAVVIHVPQLDAQDVKEKAFDAPNNVKIKVRMEGPYTADVPLQIVCYFKYTPEIMARMTGAPVELDKKLGGIIAALRQRGEFAGDELETMLIMPPANTIKAKALLLVGLGTEENLSLAVMQRVGRVSLREAVRLSATTVAFAPLIRDQGNSKLPTGDIEVAVVKAMLVAYDTDKRLQNEGYAKPFTLRQWNVEAGPTYFDETVRGVQTAIKEAKAAIAQRPSSN